MIGKGPGLLESMRTAGRTVGNRRKARPVPSRAPQLQSLRLAHRLPKAPPSMLQETVAADVALPPLDASMWFLDSRRVRSAPDGKDGAASLSIVSRPRPPWLARTIVTYLSLIRPIPCKLGLS